MNSNMNSNTNIKNVSISSRIQNTPNSHVLEFDENAPLNLPDVDSITDKVIEIMEYIDNPELLKLREDDKAEFVSHMESKFKNFSDRYFSLFIKLINGDDITPLWSMLSAIDDIKSGRRDAATAERGVGDMLRDNFPLLPKSSK